MRRSLPQPAPAQARESLNAHVVARGAELRQKYGPQIGIAELHRILADRDFVRYPCELAFDAAPLEPGELAYPNPKGERPEDGFVLCLHPDLAAHPFGVPLISLYQLVAVNYGAFAAPDDAEAFGAAALGLDKEDYYQAICELADAIGDGGSSDEDCGSGCGGGCSCGSHS